MESVFFQHLKICNFNISSSIFFNYILLYLLFNKVSNKNYKSIYVVFWQYKLIHFFNYSKNYQFLSNVKMPQIYFLTKCEKSSKCLEIIFNSFVKLKYIF